MNYEQKIFGLDFEMKVSAKVPCPGRVTSGESGYTHARPELFDIWADQVNP